MKCFSGLTSSILKPLSLVTIALCLSSVLFRSEPKVPPGWIVHESGWTRGNAQSAPAWVAASPWKGRELQGFLLQPLSANMTGWHFQKRRY